MLGWLLGKVAMGVIAAIIIDTVIDSLPALISELKNKAIKWARVKGIKQIVNDPGIVHVELDAVDEDEKAVQITMETNREFAERELSEGKIITTT